MISEMPFVSIRFLKLHFQRSAHSLSRHMNMQARDVACNIMLLNSTIIKVKTDIHFVVVGKIRVENSPFAKYA